MDRLVLHNGSQSVTFLAVEGGYRPEWIRLGDRPMLRFKDHEFLNIGALRVTSGACREQLAEALAFGGQVAFGSVQVGWTVRVSLPDDGGSGFLVTTTLTPLQEPIELLEAMSTFELPYEYDGSEQQMTYLGQQPLYRFEGDTEVSGAGYRHPNWYYGRPGRAHLTFPTQAPVMCCRVADADGGNARCTTLIGNFDCCSVKDLFAQPTRALRDTPADLPFPDPQLCMAPGKRGRKFLIGALNWNISLHKDPNVLVEAGDGLRQQVLLDVAGELSGGRWDTWMADAWARMLRLHFPQDGHVPAWEIAKSRGASWVEAAEWLTAQFAKPEGCPGFFYPERGTCVYAPHTRPGWDPGLAFFCGQWLGPVSYLAHAWNDDAMRQASDRLEALFVQDTGHSPEVIWTIGPTPMYIAALRKAAVAPLSPALREKAADFIRRRTTFLLDPPAGARRGDAGVYALEAFANLLAADVFDRDWHEAAARKLLTRVNRQLDARFESFNCAAEDDFVSANQGRPFGHGIAMSANLLAHQRFGDDAYLEAADRCGNLMLALYYAGYNNAESPDLDTRGWAVGANGGRDQLCHLPPWETAFGMQQLAYQILAGRAEARVYDLFWLFAHTGLAMFPKARAFKRLYTPGMREVYRQIDTLPTEREFYLKFPYLAYEEPWDQTMLAGYQGVEPIILSLLLGGSLIAAEDDRVLALVPQAAAYDPRIAERFTVHLWNPLAEPLTTRLHVTLATKRGQTYTSPAGSVTPSAPPPPPPPTPPREVLTVTFTAGA